LHATGGWKDSPSCRVVEWRREVDRAGDWGGHRCQTRVSRKAEERNEAPDKARG
jgi:hypothetical protein